MCLNNFLVFGKLFKLRKTGFGMVKRDFKGKMAAVFIVVATLVLSFVFSTVSFTGYVASEGFEVNSGANALALVFFITGLAGSYFLLRRQ